MIVTLPRRLEKIDIRGNPFKDIPDVAAALSTIPNLKHLFMTLKAEADEDALFSFLPKVLLSSSLCNPSMWFASHKIIQTSVDNFRSYPNKNCYVLSLKI